MPRLVDTNLIVRFLVNDNPIQALAAEKVFKENDLVLVDMILAEVVWTLQSFYKLPKQDIVEKLYNFLQARNFIFNRGVILNSLFIYLNNNVSFIDAYLAAYSEDEKLEGIYSFDKGLDKIKEIERFEPK